MKHILLHKQKGFTLVETLVAITVLMIAVAGPLVVASKGLTAATTARDQMTASFLAQESMEVIKNLRDNNLHNGTTWLNNIQSCTQSAPCDASSLSTSAIVTCPAGQAAFGNQQECPIYSGTEGFTHDSTATQSQFYRYYYFNDVCANKSPCTEPTPAEEEVHVVVDWKEVNIPYEIDLTSEIVNTSRG